MINCGKTRQSGPTVQSHDSGRTKLCAGFRFVQFLIWEMVSVVVAGIAVPSVLWSRAPSNVSLLVEFHSGTPARTSSLQFSVLCSVRR
jgi:hypothetical protein